MSITGDTKKPITMYDPFTYALEQMQLMLKPIDTNVRWAFFNGYQAIQAASLEPTVKNGLPPEFKPIKSGDLKSRNAYLDTVRYLSIAEIRTSWAIELVEPRAQQPKITSPHKDKGNLYTVIRCIAALYNRLHILRLNMPSGKEKTLNPRFATARKFIIGPCQDTARYSAYQAVRLSNDVLHGAMNEGQIGDSSITYCRVCTVRAIDGNGAGGRCNTCTKYFYRNGTERPKRLDGNFHPLKEAMDAQKRRMGRGEGFGHS